MIQLADVSYDLVTALAGFTSTGAQAMLGPDGPALFGGTRLFRRTLLEDPRRAALSPLDAPLSLGADLALLPASLKNELSHLRSGKRVRLVGEC